MVYKIYNIYNILYTILDTYLSEKIRYLLRYLMLEIYMLDILYVKIYVILGILFVNEDSSYNI